MMVSASGWRAIIADPNRAQKHVWRTRIILVSMDWLNVAEIARRVGVSRPAVWRWQQRYAEAGVKGLLRYKTRKPGKASTRTGDRGARHHSDM